MKNIKPIFFLCLILAAGCTSNNEVDNSKVLYPENYRDWTHIKSMVILPGHPLENPFKGIHHIYGNPKALEGYQTGNFPNGAAIVFDLLEYNEKENTMQEGSRKLIGVMEKDTNRFSKTGGWGYEGFGGDSKTERLTNDGGASCYGCHSSQQGQDYVFSRFRK